MNRKEDSMELSSDTYNDKKTKKKLNKKVVFAVAVGVIALTIGIVACVTLTKPNEEEIIDENDLLVTSKDKYEGLNYTQTKIDIEKKSFFYDLDRNIEGSKIDVSYISVSGLKDTELEEKINTKLKEVASQMYDVTSIDNSNVLYDHVYNYTDVYIFNNVLSTMYCREFCDIEGNISYEYRGVNINLANFEDIKFADIFTNTTNLNDVVSEKIKQKVDDGSIIFSISPKNIYIVNEENIDKVNLYENIDKVAIYKRYANDKKLFNKTYSAQPYVFTTKKFYETDSYGLVEINLFIDTYNKYASEEINYTNKVMEELDNLYKEAVNEAKKLSYANPSKRYIVQIVPNIEELEDGNLNLAITSTDFEINKDFFSNNIEEFIIASENKTEEELSIVQYFIEPVMDAQNYLIRTSTNILEKVVDKNGDEIKEEIIIEESVEETVEDKEPEGVS